MGRLLRFEKPSPEIPPVLPFSKGGELLGNPQWKIPLFSPLERGRKGDFMGFQKIKLLRGKHVSAKNTGT
jgi:hypothetical protein